MEVIETVIRLFFLSAMSGLLGAICGFTSAILIHNLLDLRGGLGRGLISGAILTPIVGAPVSVAYLFFEEGNITLGLVPLVALVTAGSLTWRYLQIKD